MVKGDYVGCAYCNGRGWTGPRDSVTGPPCPICKGGGTVVQRGRFGLRGLSEEIRTLIFTLNLVFVGEKLPIGIMQNFYCNATGIDRLTWDGMTIQTVEGTEQAKAASSRIVCCDR